MSKAIILTAVLLMLSTFRLSAETVLVAPVIVYDKDSKIVTLDKNPSEEIYERISIHWFEGLISFRQLSPKEYGEIYTVFDANRCCAVENADYILFGYIQRNDGNWLADVKLYDYKAKKLSKEFFSSDDISHYERLLDSLCENILTGLEEETGLDSDEIRKEEERPFEIKLPVQFFYWNPIDSSWNSRITGIVGISVGTEIYPPQPKVVLWQKLFDFSLRPELSYSYGVGKRSAYPLNYNAISFAFPLCVHMHFNMKNSIYAGAGIYYEITLMKITPKYEERKFLYQNAFGIESLIGYEFKVGDLMNLFTEIKFDFHFNRDIFISIKPAFGISFNLFRRQP